MRLLISASTAAILLATSVGAQAGPLGLATSGNAPTGPGDGVATASYVSATRDAGGTTVGTGTGRQSRVPVSSSSTVGSGNFGGNQSAIVGVATPAGPNHNISAFGAGGVQGHGIDASAYRSVQTH
jgi:hypothetical protein